MNERIKALRKALGLTQQELADRLRIKRNTVAQYEIGRNPPTDTVVFLICREFNVSETWLRTGEGDMFLQRSRDAELAAFMGDALSGTPDFRRRLLSVLARLSPGGWELLERMANRLVAEMEKENAGPD